MNKRIAIVTGATGGFGSEFVRNLVNEEVDEIWAVARNNDKLETLKKELGDKIRIVKCDLCNMPEVLELNKLIEEEKPVIKYLVNNAGIGKMGLYKDFTLEEIDTTVNINCKAAILLCRMCIPYMKAGSRILNISSASSFQPNPYINLYAASKVFERSYSRALNVELKGTGITVTAVCPGWVRTELLLNEINGKTIKFPGIVDVGDVIKKAMKDAKKGKDMSVYSLYVKCLHLNSKIFPQKLIMKLWLKSIKEYI